MAEEYVKRQEFDDLKIKVDKMEEAFTDNAQTIHEIDKKVDVIVANVSNSDKINDLKNKPLEEKIDINTKDIEKIKEDKDKLFWAVVGEFIGLIMIAIKTALHY